MSMSAETLSVETVSYVKLSVEYIPSDEVVYKFKKKFFCPINSFHVSNCHLDITKEFWGLRALQSWHSALSQCFWVFANKSRPAACRAYAHEGPTIPKRYLKGRF